MARAGSRDLLADYKAKRDFGKTPEPGPKRGKAKGNSFVIQKHAARRTHFDFRLEHDGVLKSWAVTRGPEPRPGAKASGGDDRGPSARIWRLRRRDPQGRIWRRPGDDLGRGHVGAAQRSRRGPGQRRPQVPPARPPAERRLRAGAHEAAQGGSWPAELAPDQEARRLCRRGRRADRRVRYQREDRPHHGSDPDRRLRRMDLQQGSKKNSGAPSARQRQSPSEKSRPRASSRLRRA